MIQRFKADLVYGQSGCRKTTNVGLAASYYYELTGKRTRLVSADGGGFEPIAPLVAAGIVEVWPINDQVHPIEALDLACQGYWPADPADPKSKALPPTAETWKQVSMIALEGLTSMGDLILRRLRDSKARLSQDPAYSWADGSTTYSGSNMSYYGFVQDRLYDFAMKTQMIPVDRVLWTALEGKGEEEGTRIPIYGPAIAGKKATGKAAQWFGNCLHIEVLTTEEADVRTKQINIKSEPVMYLRNHADPLTKIVFTAKTRVPYQLAGELPVYMEPDLGKLYRKIAALQQHALESIQKEQAVATHTT